MKFLLFITFAILTSCTGYYHLKKAERHTQKAISKGATIEIDTLQIAISDTITEIDTLDNYIRITKTIRDTLYIQGNTTYIAKSRAEVRQEQRTERKKIKQDAKTERKQAKVKAKTERKTNLGRKLVNMLFFILIFCALILSYKLYKKTK